jgi:N-acetylmuramic acid 6-phosphate (MurNAc-6-P) etherase
MSRILDILGLNPSTQSRDYVENKRQFHLFHLVTEQRHPATWSLSFALRSNTEKGLAMLLSVDRDVSRKVCKLAESPAILERAAEAVAEAVRSGRRVFFYGCGATGRLAIQMESSFWRPFWQRIKLGEIWPKLRAAFPPDVEDAVHGEITGADRALVSSLEGFEDLQLIGRRQLQERRLRAGDVVFCITEGGETSSVIGAMLAAVDSNAPLDAERLREASKRLYFVYNNPDDLLRPLERSAAVLDNPAVTRVNLTTGPQAVTGSTRLQAATIETFVLGVVLEHALLQLLRPLLEPAELQELGLPPNRTLAQRLWDFPHVKASVDRSLSSLSRFSELEAETYRNNRFTTYFAKAALNTVFVDSTERSPTFRLYPLDSIREPERRSWVQVWTEAADLREAWRAILRRPFHGLDQSLYGASLEAGVSDPYLKETALRSLTQAGADQESCYDFSFSGANVASRGPSSEDLGVIVAIDGEAAGLQDPGSAFGRFEALFRSRGGRLVLITTAEVESAVAERFDATVSMPAPSQADPLQLRRQVALKMLLNAHSTAVMAKLGRVIGNTMTNVSPSNLKLIGRATSLVMSHVNDVLTQSFGYSNADLVSFAEANAVLMDAVEYVRANAIGETAEVGLSIVRIIEAFRTTAPVDWDAAREILDQEGLAAYLLRNNPALDPC